MREALSVAAVIGAAFVLAAQAFSWAQKGPLSPTGGEGRVRGR